ncbi:hypothetical protein HHK36_017225 [Tetracentron sinense]|uniref:Uncharacterized protein n=1 Tax=Tetracentron sinense TaxID=13715 RepID=A0A835DBQ5_TETSI|nr:hypothetical protein HHK36_017225 [Tetracentron sinense]
MEANKKWYDPSVVSIGPYHHDKPELKPMDKLKIPITQQFIQDSCKLVNVFYNEYYDDEISPDELCNIILDLFLLDNQIPFIVLKELMRLRFHGDDEGKQMISNFIIEQATNEYEELHYDNFWAYHSATELKAMGIKFKRSRTSHFKDVVFKAYPVHGELSLPPILVKESTKAKFFNLIAYENCPDTPQDSGVSSYAYFMRALIANGNDVKELRLVGILQNFLSGDEQVVDLFKKLATGALTDVLVYGIVKGQIRKYCHSNMIRMRIWMVEVKHTYFRSP